MAFTEFDRIDFSNIKDFTKEIKMAISRIRSSGFELGSQALAVMVLGKLPKSFESFIRVVTHDEKKLEVEDVIRKLEKDDFANQSDDEDPIALVATVEEQVSAQESTGKVQNVPRLPYNLISLTSLWRNKATRTSTTRYPAPKTYLKSYR